MKIALTATGKNVDAAIDQRFGRCQYFIIIDIETMQTKAITNESEMASGGAGIQAAQKIAKEGVGVVITGNIGPNAFQTLAAAGIKVVTGVTGTVSDVVNKWKQGQLNETETPTVGNHFGMKNR
jgi:predicted Fe-Mo cluster-binding NifX family protein